MDEISKITVACVTWALYSAIYVYCFLKQSEFIFFDIIKLVSLSLLYLIKDFLDTNWLLFADNPVEYIPEDIILHTIYVSKCPVNNTTYLRLVVDFFLSALWV